jgi:hypothetical protein
MLTVQDAEQVIDDLDALEARLAAHFEMLMVLPLFCQGETFFVTYLHVLLLSKCQSVSRNKISKQCRAISCDPN